jgi:hypothetical protein
VDGDVSLKLNMSLLSILSPLNVCFDLTRPDDVKSGGLVDLFRYLRTDARYRSNLLHSKKCATFIPPACDDETCVLIDEKDSNEKFATHDT